MKKKLPTVTVAVSAYNEEKNIGLFLKSVLSQNEIGFILKMICIYSDGSTDRTVKIARSINDKRIKVFVFTKREGKPHRLNQIYRKVDTDFLIQSDSDVIFAHRFVIQQIIQPFIKDKKVALVGGNRIPQKSRTLVEHIHIHGFNIWSKVRNRIKKNSIHNHHGSISALKKNLSLKLHIPEEVNGTDDYIFLMNKKLGFTFKYIPSATVFFKSPQTLKDYFKQQRRFLSAKYKMASIFGPQVYLEYNINKKTKWPILLEEIFKKPVLTILYLILETGVRLSTSVNKYSQHRYWDIAVSTK
ncbi:glycosyltransferase [Candidatus Gottesmanbacteria bacterium]|nr:glycosyltransferase [Candidatus Gottesmanbacteria bacterium]